MNEMDGMGRWIPPAQPTNDRCPHGAHMLNGCKECGRYPKFVPAQPPEGTPRTQAALLDAKLKHSFPNASFVHADFARTLELELLALNMELRNARSRVAECEADMVAGWKVQEERAEKVERLERQVADAIAEGCKADEPETWWQGYADTGDPVGLIHQQVQGDEPPEWMIEPHKMRPTPWLEHSAKKHYEILWLKINGAGSWDANPFVWVVEFKALGTAKVTAGEPLETTESA